MNQKQDTTLDSHGRKGVKVRIGTRDDLPVFYDIMKTTGSRDDFFIRPLSYFQKIYDEMGERTRKSLYCRI